MRLMALTNADDGTVVLLSEHGPWLLALHGFVDSWPEWAIVNPETGEFIVLRESSEEIYRAYRQAGWRVQPAASVFGNVPANRRSALT